MSATVDFSGLVGTPFAYGGRGPDAYDCYGVLVELHRRQGIVLPQQNSPSKQEMIAALMGLNLFEWQPCDRTPGACVLFRVGRFVSHCGMMVDHFRMIHAWEKCGGVTIERIEPWMKRVVGYYRFTGKK